MMDEDPWGFFQLATSEGITIIRVIDHRILSTARETFYGLAARVAEASEPRRVLLNLANLRQFESIMIGVLINFRKRIAEVSGTLELCEVDPYILNLFRLTKLDEMFTIHETEERAIETLRGGPRPSWLARLRGSR